MSKSPVPFCYPAKPHVRKHGPSGYGHWEQYRDWLRDDFEFRCVYCLRREKWDRKRAAWVVEHLIPREKSPSLALEYTNLVYACASCNSAKSTKWIPDPCEHAYGELVFVTEDGEIHARSPEGKRLIRNAGLGETDAVGWREKLIAIFRMYKRYEPARYRAELGYPEGLPDLTRKQAPRNTKPDGAQDCRYQQKLNGTLPTISV